MEQTTARIKWFFRPGGIILAVLCVGPLALPLVWLSPALRKKDKAIITILLVVLTIWLAKASIRLYGLLLKELEDLQNILGK